MRILANGLFALLLLLSCQPKESKSAEARSSAAPSAANNGLTVYSYRYLVQDQSLYRQYTSRSGKPINIYRYDTDKMIALAQAGQLRGDLVIVDDLYAAHQLKKAGALQPYSAGTFGDYVPNRFVDQEGYWAGLSRWTMSFVFRKEAFSDMTAFQTYAEAIQPELKGRIVMAHPDSSGLTTMVAGMIAAHGVQPTELYLQSLQANLAAPPVGNDLDALQLLIEGKADVALMKGSTFLQYRHSGNPDAFRATEGLDLEIPVDARGNNYYNINPICILKGTPQHNYAVTLVEFLTLQSSQDLAAPAGMEYPTNVFSEMSDFLNDPFNVPQGEISPEDAEAHLDTARELIRQVFGL
ncbi:MAG: hypothetical protein D6772_11345 [Bacteroidetes bacterium]|nr:MAG: hypothetical protein D6772_11345 [Bacteroidota bacterium]